MPYQVVESYQGLALMEHVCNTPLSFASYLGSPRYAHITGTDSITIPGSKSPFKPKRLFFMSEEGKPTDLFGNGFFYWFTEELFNMKSSKERYDYMRSILENADDYKRQVLATALVLNDIRGGIFLPEDYVRGHKHLTADYLKLDNSPQKLNSKRVVEILSGLAFKEESTITVEVANEFVEHFEQEDRKMARLAIANWHGMLYLSIPKKYSYPLVNEIFNYYGIDV